MLLTIDIGNSNIVFGLPAGEGRARRLYRLGTVPERPVEEYFTLAASLFAREGVELGRVDGAVICSVVPVLVPVLSQVVQRLTGITPYIVTSRSKSGLPQAIVVDQQRRYIGGAILAGVRLGVQALFSGTAQLPSVSIQAPKQAICGTALESIQSGAVFGAAAMMDGLAERFEAELGKKCTLLATGGLAECIVPHCRREFIYDESLLLRGMELIYRLNCKK